MSIDRNTQGGIHARDGGHDTAQAKLPEPVIYTIGNEHFAGRSYSKALSHALQRVGSEIHFGIDRLTAIATVGGDASAGNCRDLPVDVDSADALVERVSDVEIALVVKSKSTRGVKHCVQGRSSVPSIPGFASAGHRANDSIDAKLPNRVVAGVGNEDRVAKADGDAGGKIQLRLDCRLSVSRIPGFAGSGNSADDPVRVDPAHTIAERVGDVDPARAVDRQSLWRGQLGQGGWAAVSDMARITRSRQGGDPPVRLDLTDSVAFGDVDLATRPGRDRHGTDQCCGGCQASVGRG